MPKLGYTKSQNYRVALKHSADLFGKNIICMSFMRRVWTCAYSDHWDDLYKWSQAEHLRALNNNH